MDYTVQTQPKDMGKWQYALHSTYRLIRTLTLSKKMQIGPWLNPGSIGRVYYPPQDHILKEKSQGWTAYRPLLIKQVITSHRCFIKTEENYIPSPPTDSLNIKTERINSCTVKCLFTGITSSSKQSQVKHQTWLPSYQPN